MTATGDAGAGEGGEWWGASFLWGKTYGFYLGVPAT